VDSVYIGGGRNKRNFEGGFCIFPKLQSPFYKYIDFLQNFQLSSLLA